MNKLARLLFSAVFIGFSGPVFAQAEKGKEVAKESASFLASLSPEVAIGGVLVVFLLGLLTIFLVMTFVSALPVLYSFYDRPENRDLPMAKVVGLFRGDTRSFVGEHKDVLIEDHSYDGIHEFDNDLPPWWKYSFYATVVFGFVYLLHYHVLDSGKLQDAEYEVEIQQAALLSAAEESDPNAKTNFKVLTEASAIDNGKATFAQNCAACHGKNAEGAVGPNLTDEFWLHGGEVNEIYKTIKFGVTAKGMVAWDKKLNKNQMLEVASYILSLQGSKPANAKAPQGDKVDMKK